MKDEIRELFTLLCVWGIRRLNKHKDSLLADRLHRLAGLYQTNPQEGWKPPRDWECWKN